MRRLICAFVVHLWNKQVLSWHGSNYPSSFCQLPKSIPVRNYQLNYAMKADKTQRSYSNFYQSLLKSKEKKSNLFPLYLKTFFGERCFDEESFLFFKLYVWTKELVYCMMLFKCKANYLFIIIKTLSLFKYYYYSAFIVCLFWSLIWFLSLEAQTAFNS